MGSLPATTLALLMACLLGLLAHLLVFRPLRNAPALGKVIGAVGIMLYLQAVASLNFGAEARQNPGFLPSTSGDNAFFTNFLGLGNLPHLIVWMAGCAIVMGAAVWALLDLHPLRPRHPGGRREREGGQPPRLLAAAPRRPQLGALGPPGRHHRPRRHRPRLAAGRPVHALRDPRPRRRPRRQPHLDPARGGGRLPHRHVPVRHGRGGRPVLVAALAARQRHARARARCWPSCSCSSSEGPACRYAAASSSAASRSRSPPTAPGSASASDWSSSSCCPTSSRPSGRSR